MPFGLVDDGISGAFADVTLRRRAAGSYVAGRWTQGAETTSTIRASVQPARGEFLEDLPPAVRVRALMEVWSASELRAGIEGSATPTEPDRIDHLGEQWEVVAVETWGTGNLDHYHAVIARVERG